MRKEKKNGTQFLFFFFLSSLKKIFFFKNHLNFYIFLCLLSFIILIFKFIHVLILIKVFKIKSVNKPIDNNYFYIFFLKKKKKKRLNIFKQSDKAIFR